MTLTPHRRTLLATAPAAFFDWELWHYAAGLYPAGSGTRTQATDTYLVTRRRRDGTTVGRHYRTLDEARAVFAQHATPATEEK